MMKSAARTMLLRGWDTPNCLVQQFHPAIRSILQRRCRSNYIRASLRSYKSFESSMEQFGLALLHPGTPFLGSLQPESSRRWHTALRAEEGPDNALHPRIKALLIDAAGTLIEPTEPLTDVYMRYTKPYGCTRSEEEILREFRRAYNADWTESVLRYVGDARPFWRHVVTQSTGCDHPEAFENIYQYFAEPEAWRLTTPDVRPALQRLRDAGVKLAVVSNFDTRLRQILEGLGVMDLFDVCIVSAEVGAEKPNPVIFEHALEQLGVLPEETVHVGDDRRNDISGARSVGCYAWMWGLDVNSFTEVAHRILDPESDDEDDVFDTKIRSFPETL